MLLVLRRENRGLGARGFQKVGYPQLKVIHTEKFNFYKFRFPERKTV